MLLLAVQWITPDNRRQCLISDDVQPEPTVYPAGRRVDRLSSPVQELLLILQAHFWRTIMELLLMLLAVFFGAVVCWSSARLYRLLQAAAGRRASRLLITGRTVSD